MAEDTLTDAEVVEWQRLASVSRDSIVHCGKHEKADEALAVFTQEALPKLLAELKAASKAEVKRLRAVLAKSNRTTRYAGYCCVCALSNLMPDSREEFDKFVEAADAAGGDDATKPELGGE